jgi:hypothetical protein
VLLNADHAKEIRLFCLHSASAIVAAKNTLKDFLRTSGNHHCRLLDPGMDIGNKGPEEIWGEDPTQPRPEVFDSMVAALPMAEARIDTAKRQGEGGQEPAAKRPKQDTSTRRNAEQGGWSGGASRGNGNNYRYGWRGGRRWPSARGRGGWKGWQRQEGWYHPRYSGGRSGGGSGGGGGNNRGGSWRQPRGGGGWKYSGRGDLEDPNLDEAAIMKTMLLFFLLFVFLFSSDLNCVNMSSSQFFLFCIL